MTAEREYLSAAAFAAGAAGVENVYIDKAAEGFSLPAVYFAPPEVKGGTAAAGSYSAEYCAEAVFYAKSTRAAYALAHAAFDAIASAGYTVPLLTEDGGDAGESIRISSLGIKPEKNGECVLRLSWKSVRKNGEGASYRERIRDIVMRIVIRSE